MKHNTPWTSLALGVRSAEITVGAHAHDAEAGKEGSAEQLRAARERYRLALTALSTAAQMALEQEGGG